MAASFMFNVPSPAWTNLVNGFTYYDGGYGVDSWLGFSSPTSSFTIPRITVSWCPSDASRLSLQPRLQLGFAYIPSQGPTAFSISAQSALSYYTGASTTQMWPMQNITGAPPTAQVVWSPNASDSVLTLNYADLSPSLGANAGDTIAISLIAHYNDWVDHGFERSGSVLDDYAVSVIIEEVD